MTNYLGEEIIDCKDTVEYKDYTAQDWALHWMFMYAQIDGAHHKAWVLDQVARILNGTKVIIKKASWDNGKCEYRFDLDDPSSTYKEWIKIYEDADEDGEPQYEWDTGCAP